MQQFPPTTCNIRMMQYIYNVISSNIYILHEADIYKTSAHSNFFTTISDAHDDHHPFLQQLGQQPGVHLQPEHPLGRSFSLWSQLNPGISLPRLLVPLCMDGLLMTLGPCSAVLAAGLFMAAGFFMAPRPRPRPRPLPRPLRPRPRPRPRPR